MITEVVTVGLEQEPVEVHVDLSRLLGDEWRDPWWRICNLYWIVDENGKQVRFQPNEEQQEFYDNLHTRNVILKARQLGFSTFMQILALDQSTFNPDFNVVVIADTLPNATKLFRKITFALGKLPELIRAALPLDTESKTELIFSNGSSVSVSTSARGGTVQLLHVSELGKISRKFPDRALEIKTGALEAMSADSIAVIESTAEGNSGLLFEIVDAALKRMEAGEPETRLDWRLHFFPWFKKKAYRMTDAETAIVNISPKQHEYFDKIEAECNVTLDANQRAWYVKKKETLGDDMGREYPSTPREAFEQAIEGAVYSKQMTALRKAGKLTTVPLDPNFKVNTFWDLGASVGNATCIWFHQRIGLQNRFPAYHEDEGEDLKHYWLLLEEMRAEHEFQWGTHYLPHDADADILGEVVTTKKKILEKLGMKNIVVVPRIPDITTGIDVTRSRMVADVWIDKNNCAQGIKALDNYQYRWDENLGRWSREPLHNWASNGADSFRQWAQGYSGEVGGGSLQAFKKRKRG